MASKAGRLFRVAARGKSKRSSAVVSPAASSNLGKFLGIPEPPRSHTAELISKFIKISNRQNSGMKKEAFTEEKLKALLSGKERIGIPEIAKLLSGQITRTTTING